MSYKIRRVLGPGLTRLVTDQLRWIRFSALRLAAGQKWTVEGSDWEQGLVLLSGICRVTIKGREPAMMGPRRSVFTDPAYAAYLPVNGSLSLEALVESELALFEAPGEKGGESVLVTPHDLVYHQRGKPGFERQVVDIIMDNVNAKSIMAGETINAAGQWSSYPPHKHEVDNLPEESLQEEVYLFKLDPRQGFGFQRIYNDDRSLDETYTLEDNDVVIIPRGYHPVAVAPGYKIYYLWVLAGTSRKLCPKDDPQHAWAK